MLRIEIMEHALQGMEPVLRTYNTLIIACNMCNQPREAMAVYKRMLDEGYTPNATTYNALISAHGKAGQLDQVMEVCHVYIPYKHFDCTRAQYPDAIPELADSGRFS